MPYIPNLVPDGSGRALDLFHASIRSALFKSIQHTSSQPAPQENHLLTMRGLGNYNSINTTAIYAMNQQRTRQIVATASSVVSLGSALLAVFWFIMMRRNFRRDLVLLLILGGAFKSLWFTVFSVYSFVHGAVQTETAFCQANGYLLQVGFEQCDAAVLFMSMHMYYQIFPTTRFGLGHDGLYKVRRWVYAAWFLLPNLSAGLAFINPRSGFMAQGGFCSLPLRPFWYRIALFWGPRYLIWCYVVFVAVRIYRYVGSEFKVFGQERDRSESLGVPGNSSVDRMMQTEFEQRRRSRRFSSFGLGKKEEEAEVECAPDDVASTCAIRPKTAPSAESPKISLSNYTRRQSTPNWTTSFGSIDEGTTLELPPPLPTSAPASRRGSQQISNGVTAEDFAPPPPIVMNGHRGSVTSLGSKKSAASADLPSGLPSIVEGKAASQSVEDSRPTASGAMRLRRLLIQRQLRLLFIYPCIYMLLWVIPLVVNIMNYTDYFAQHPVFVIGILQLLCITLMTFVDVVVFCWRERPWRHIPGSDGSFTGSLMFWRYCFGAQWARDRRASSVQSYVDDEKIAGNENSQSRTRLLSALKRWSVGRKVSRPRGSDASPSKQTRPTMHKRNYSGGSERKQMAADRAHERLALERADYEQNRRSLQERRLSVVSQPAPAPAAAPPDKERKDWFDDQDVDLFKDVELEEDEKRTASGSSR